MELKYSFDGIGKAIGGRSNRTFMELKSNMASEAAE